jgi:hypothetical protein
VKIQGESQVLGLPIADRDGRRLGRIVAVDCAPQDPYTAMWFVVRIGGWRHGLRAVPAEHAAWYAGGGLDVPVRREVVLASPAPATADLDAASRIAVADYYTHLHVRG